MENRSVSNANNVLEIPKEKRNRNPLEKEQKIYNYLRLKQEEGISQLSFHDLQNAIKLSSGALQATIIRCLKEDSEYRIYETTNISDRNKRLTRMFSLQPQNNSPPISNLHKLLDSYQKLIQGEIINLNDYFILPLKLDSLTVSLLKIIPEVSSEYPDLTKIFEEALSFFIKEKLSPEIKKNALSLLKEKKLIKN